MSDLELQIFDRESVYNARKKALINESGRQFSQKGFHGTSMTDIAKGIKLTKSGLFHYVKTKEELLYLCYEDAIKSAWQHVQEAQKVDGNALDKLAYYIRCHLERFDRPDGFFVALTELHVLSEDQQKALFVYVKKIDRALRQLVQDGIDEGVIGYSNPRIAVHAIEGALNWVPEWHSRKKIENVAELADDFIEFFINGLKGKAR